MLKFVSNNNGSVIFVWEGKRIVGTIHPTESGIRFMSVYELQVAITNLEPQTAIINVDFELEGEVK